MRSIFKLMLVLLVAQVCNLNAATYYVATNGLDANAGTLGAPWRTIQKAATTMVAGDTCYVRGGTYRETVTPLQSGTSLSPITYQNYSNEVAIISGAEVITNWTVDAGSVYKAAMSGNFFNSAFNESDQVFVDGQMMTLAKWPNVTTATTAYPGGVAPAVDISHPAKSVLTSDSQPAVFDNSTGTNWYYFTFTDTALPAQTNGYYVGAEMYVQPGNGIWSWTFNGTIVAHTNQTLTLRSANSGPGTHVTPTNTIPVGSRYYLYNMRRLLDTNSEWFHDKTGGLLYLQTPDGSSPAGHLVEARARDYAFNLNACRYIVVRGFNLFACSITTDTGAGGNNINFDATNKMTYPWRSGGSYASANHITLDGLNAKYLWNFTDVSGHFFWQWGQSSGIVLSGDDCVLMNSTLQYSAGNGVSVLGHRNKVLNNTISDVCYSPTDSAFINTGGAQQYFDIEIASNVCVRAGRSGITPRGLVNSNPTNTLARIHHNDVSQCMIQDWDGGGLYAADLGGTGNFARIDHNLFHDNADYSGIYLDYQKDWIIDHNVVWNVQSGIQLQGDATANILCYNNTISATSVGFKDQLGVNAGTVIQNNIIFGSSGYTSIDSGFASATVSNNLLWDSIPGSATDPKFVNSATNNYQLQVNSPARNAGVQIPVYVRDGVSVPAYSDAVDNLPDLGAYEYPTTLYMQSNSFAIAIGNTNSWIDPGETVNETIVYGNYGSVTLTNISATLATANTGITMLTSSVLFSNVVSGGLVTNVTPFSYRLAKTVPGGTTLTFTLAASANGQAFTNIITRTVGYLVNNNFVTNSFYGTNLPTAIPDVTTIYSTNNVSSIAGAVIDKVTAGIRINHTWDGDLLISVIHPDATEVILANREGNSGHNYGSTVGSVTNLTIFDDSANSTPISSGNSPFVGTYQPDGQLSALNGKIVAGQWRLKVSDMAAGDSGTLLAWYLNITSHTGSNSISIYNNPPVAFSATNNIPTNTSSLLVLSAMDVDGDTLAYVTNSAPAHGTLSGFNSTNGSVTYTPANNYSGSDSFTFSVNDGSTNSALATITLNITGSGGLNHPPVASNATYTVSANMATNLVLTGSDPDGNTLTYMISGLPQHGSLYGLNSASGGVTYLPAPGYTGSDSFTFMVSDGVTNSATATVSITVQSVVDTNLIVYEGFNYAIGSSAPSSDGGLNSGNGLPASNVGGNPAGTGTGLRNSWGTALSVSNGLTYSQGNNVLATVGGTGSPTNATWGTGNIYPYRNMTTDPFLNQRVGGVNNGGFGVDGTNLFISMLAKTTSSTAKAFYFCLGGATATTTRNVFVGNTSTGWSLDENGGAAVPTTGSLSVGATTLLVIRIDFVAGTNDAFNLWVNPPLGVPLGNPNATLTTISNFGSFGGGANQAFVPRPQFLNAMTFDEIRMGTTFASVTPFLTVPPAATNVVTSTANPSTYGNPVTFTATLSGGSGVPTGLVQFLDGTNNLGLPVALNGSGVASLSVSNLTAGVHTISASFGGNASYSATNGLLIGGQTVNPKPLTVTGLTAIGKTYDAGTNAALTGTASLSGGVLTGDSVTLSGSPMASFASKTVGTNKPVTVSGYALGGASATNYSLSAPAGLTVNITALTIAVTNVIANDKTYDGTINATLNTGGAGLSGVLNGDIVSLNTASAVGTFANPAAGVKKTVFISGLNISGNDATNYSLTQPITDATIYPITSTAALAVNNSPVTYNGFGQSATVSITASNTLGTVQNISIGGAANQTNAGTYAVTADFVPNDTVNYTTLTGLPAGNFTISRATTTATLAVSNSPTTFSGSGLFATVSVTASNTPGTVQNILTAGAPNQTNAGTYAVTATYVPTDTNYAMLTGLSAGDFIINKAETSFLLVSSNNPSLLGSNVAFAATIFLTNGTVVTDAGGTVIFKNGSLAIATNTPSLGVTLFGTGGLPAGTNYIIAQYSGDSNRLGASNSVLQVVTAGLGFYQITLNAIGDGNGLFLFQGNPGANYALDLATNLSAPIWLPLTTNAAAANGKVNFTNYFGASQGFFRIRSVP